MNTLRPCRACKAANMEEVAYSEHLTVKGVDLHVEGLLHWECPNCNAAIETATQMDLNGELVQQAYQQHKKAFKKANRLLTGEKIRLLRTNIWDITQKQAATIFGGGPTAFSKYEAEDVAQSTAMDRLLRVSAEFPAVFDWLVNNYGDVETKQKRKSKSTEHAFSSWNNMVFHFITEEKPSDYKPQPSMSKQLIICANDHMYHHGSETISYLEAY